ncbi:MAG: PDZ domain-containing protein [Planctomycetota bacterium]
MELIIGSVLRRQTLVTICVLGLMCATPAVSTAAEDSVAATPEQIELWVRQLDDDRYDIRQRAERNLEQTGQPAMQPVADAATEGTLESVTRAVTILLKWSESSDQEFRLAVLEKMANLTNRPREAAMASRVLAEVRELAALAALQKLGAYYERIPGNHLRIQFDSKWTGGSNGLRHLADVPRVTMISFVAAPIEDSALQHLKGLKNLQRVEFYSTNLSKLAAEEFQKESPFKVDFRRALLGVKGMSNGQCRISEVEPDSAAEKAGILPGDEITEFNGEAVQDFESLTDRIRDFKAGESATLTVVREARPRQIKVTFGGWSESNINRRNSRGQVQIMPPQRRVFQRNIPAQALPAAPPRLDTPRKAIEQAIEGLEKEGQQK